MKAEEVLEKAAIVLEKEGWTQGTLENKGKRCVLGAINKVVSIEGEVGSRYASNMMRDKILPEKCKLSLAASRLFLKRIGEYEAGLNPEGVEFRITSWNDARFRRNKEVIDVCLGEK